MMKNRLLFGLLLLAAITSTAQNKMLSIDDAVSKGRTVLAPERLSQLQWIPETNQYSFVAKRQGKEVLVVQDASTGKSDSILEIADFAAALQNTLPNEKAVGRYPFITWINASAFRFNYSNKVYLFNLSNKKVTQIAAAPKEGEDLDFDPISNKLAYTMNNNLYVNQNGTENKVEGADAMGKANYENDLITKDANTAVSYGKAVHRNEFGITKGTFFSPKGNRIAFYKLMEGMVTNYQLMNVKGTDTAGNKLVSPTEFESMKYPMAGNKSHEVKVMLYDFKKKRMLEVNTTGDEEQYLTNISWSLDEEYLYIAVVNRDQNEMKLQMFDGTTGSFIKTLFTETHPKYVEPEKPMYFLKNEPGKFIWFSEKDGYNHLYLYNNKGEQVKQLTKGKMVVTDIIGTDALGTLLFYHATSTDGLNKYVYKLDMKTGVSTQINKLEGLHQGIVSSNGQYIIEQITSNTIPRRYLLLDNKGKEV
jgi:dipeptidyl-peptidase-4